MKISSFETYIDQLDKNKAIIQTLSANLTREQAVWRPDSREVKSLDEAEPRWTVLETVAHLIDIEAEDFRHDLELILFRPDERWPDFNIEEWRVERKYNTRGLGELVEKFLSERKKSIEWLQSLECPDLNASHSGNGFGGNPLRAGDIVISWVAHDLFHIRQLCLLRWDILRKWGFSYSPDYSGFRV